jgi:hypothetical protein
MSHGRTKGDGYVPPRRFLAPYALFLPFAPVVFAIYGATLTSIHRCLAELHEPCFIAGLNLNAAYTRALDMLRWTEETSAGPSLLLYIMGLAALSQFTTKGFRGRVVRTCRS